MNDSRLDRVRKQKKKRRWVWILMSCFSVALISSSYFFFQVWGAMDHAFDPLERKKPAKRSQEVTMDQPFTVLLMGADGKKGDWRTDSLMLVSIHPKKKSAKLYSIPRDTYTEIAHSNGVKTKINAAPYYARLANVDLETNVVETVENYLNIPVDYFVKIDFHGFIEVVDALGGVDVDVPFNFNMRLFYKWYTFEKGPAHLDGHEALAYVRMRKSDPQGDAGRTARQREVMQNLAGQAASLNSVTKINEIMEALGNNLGHNLKVSEIYKLQATYRSIPKENMETLKDRGYDSNEENSRGIWFHYVNDEERLRLSHIFRKHLDLPLETLDGQKFEGISPADEEKHQGSENNGDPLGTSDETSEVTKEAGQ
ncbi:LCP family protein [Kroppenstedtia sanguinis]